MQRIAIVGCSGSGKSTLARALGARLALPVTHLDALWWQPGWREPEDKEAFKAKVLEHVARDKWIIDGGYFKWGGAERYRRADTLILFDYPTWFCLYRVLRRTILHYGRAREDLAPGCPERVDWSFLTYIWRYRRVSAPRVEERIAQHFKGRLIRIRNKQDMRRLLSEGAL